jgi:molecular chaperone GrpE
MDEKNELEKQPASPKTHRRVDHSKELKQLREKIEQSEKQLLDWNEKYLRLAADYDNYRKRTQKEISEIIKYAGENILRNFLPILDDLERALANNKSAKAEDSLSQGLELIYKKFVKTMKDMEVTAIESLNTPFDPNYHHAIMVKEVEGTDSNIIVEEFEKGYVFKDHVLRHSKVVVSK